MPVTSSTIGGVNTWTFSGVVTDAQIQTAWSALVTNGVYVINRAIYLDNTADLTGCTGGFLVDFGTQVNPAIILHTARDRTKSTFNNFTFLQRTGLIVNARNSFIQTWNGTTLATQGGGTGADGLNLKGGGMVYGVPGNPGGGDPRFLNEMAFTGFEGATIYSQQFTEQELQPCVGASTTLKGVTFEKCFGFPQLGTPTGNVNVVVYRSNQNTEHPTQFPLRLYPNTNRYAAVCYIDSYVTRSNADCTTRLADAFGTNANNVANVMILNNYTRESWFGAAKTQMAVGTWASTNSFFGGVFKKLQFVNGNGGIVRCYDSRSTTAAQKCKFAETGFIDFLDTSLAPTTDATGKISLVHIGAIATGSPPAITRYTGQKYTFQKFGYRVMVGTPDMTSGDNDLSAFAPVTITAQTGLVRTQSAINLATSINSFQELLEELHVLAIGLVGAQSYAGAFEGNLFSYDGGVLTTAFATVNVDATATSKIIYDGTTNTLTIKSSTLSSNLNVNEWRNPTGKINLLNGATLNGVYEDSDGQRASVSNLDPEGFGITWYLRYKLQSASTWTNVSGTGNTALILLAEGVYDVQVRAEGYEWESSLVLDTAISLSLNAGLRYHVSANNTPQYEMAFDSALSNAFQFDAVLNKVSVTNTTGAIINPGFAELYRATQRIQHLPDLVWTWSLPVTANATSQKILIPTGNPISMYLTDDSNNTVKITCPVIHADTGASADDRVRGNPSGYSIILGSPATAESAGLQAAITAALGGPNFDTAEHGLSVIKADQDLAKAVLDLVKTAVDAIKPQTDLIPANPAAVGDAMTLTSAYDAAKTASSQASVDAVKTVVDGLENYDDTALQASVTALGSPMQADDYVAPDNTTIGAIKTKVDTLNNYDDSALVTAVGSPLQASAYVAPDNTKIGQIKTKVDTLTNYDDATAQTKLDAIKTKVDTLENTDVSSLATQASVTALGTPLQADDYVAPANSDIAAIKAKTDTLVNTDLTDVEADLAKIQKNTKLIPATL